ncbi:hypothetical protein V8F20_002339 [Naviculisporaceae sp. PSN 640]
MSNLAGPNLSQLNSQGAQPQQSADDDMSLSWCPSLLMRHEEGWEDLLRLASGYQAAVRHSLTLFLLSQKPSTCNGKIVTRLRNLSTVFEEPFYLPIPLNKSITFNSNNIPSDKMTATVHVKNIAAKTDDKEVKDFFSFCGKITSIEVQQDATSPDSKFATVTFEKETAAKTALLLNHTRLGDNEITVTSDATPDDQPPKTNADRDTDEITQEEKPRSRILAEYLAHGYLVADTSIKTAISLDEKHGVSARFLSTLQNLDQKYHATDRAKATDQSYGITARANSLLHGLSSYFEKAKDTPTGQKIANFYVSGAKQVEDIHKEAKRLAEMKKEEAGGSSYKAVGLDKIFGPEKTKPAEEAGDGGAAAPTGEVQQPTQPSEVPKV